MLPFELLSYVTLHCVGRVPKTYIAMRSAVLVACLTAVQRIASIFILAIWFSELLPTSMLVGVACSTTGILLQLYEQISEHIGTHKAYVPSSDSDTSDSDILPPEEDLGPESCHCPATIEDTAKIA